TVRLVVLELLPRGGDGSLEGRWRAVHGRRGVEDLHRPEFEFITQGARVPESAVTPVVVLKPDAGEGVTLDEHDEGMQADLLEGRSHQNGDVQTRGDAVGKDLLGRADLLARLLEACGRVGVSNAQLSQSVVHR